MNFVSALIVALLTVFAIAPLEYPGAFQSQSGLSAVYSLISLDQNPLQFFNWSPTFGTAFDLFRTEGALPYWVAEIFHRIGFGYLDSIKLVYALAWMASGWAMFALARKFFSDAGALLAATVYVYLPFHIATVYGRGAFAESVAWAWFPMALLAILRQPRTDNRRQIFVSLLPFALLYLTQPGIAILFSIFAIAVAVALKWRTQNFHPSSFTPALQRTQRGASVLNPFAGFVLGMLLTLPVIARYGARLAPNAFTPNFILPYQLFSSLWAFGDPPQSPAPTQGTFVANQMPFQLGVVAMGLAIIAMALNRNKGVQANAPTKLFLVAAIVVTLLTFSISAPLWSILGIFAAYPWQLLAFVGLALAFVAGSVMDADMRWQQPPWVAFFIALPVLASYGYLAPRYVDFSPTRPQIAVYGNNEIALLDYRIVGPLLHGATVRIELKWQALRQIDRDYTVFVHAVNDDGKTYAQDDSKPQEGALPTTKWTPGEIIFDTHTIQIDVEGPREGYHLELGLYQAANGERAIMQNGADVLLLPRRGDPPPTVSDQLPPQKSP